MQTLFLICTIIGGTILVLQVVLSLLGLGFEHLVHVGDLGHHLGDLGGAAAPDLGPASADGVELPEHAPDGELTHHGDHQGLLRVGQWLTFQTVVAFVTFFGVAGLASLESGRGVVQAVPIALASGLGAMIVVALLFGSLRKLHGDGTLEMTRAPGARGRVYLSIPGQDSGVGKVTVVLQGREIELAARTPGPDLRAGEEIVVARVLDDRTVEVVDIASYSVKPAPLA